MVDEPVESVEPLIHDIFLSHCAQDRGLAELIRRQLESAGLRVFVDKNLAPGTNITESLREEVISCSIIVILATSASLRASMLAYEVGMASAWNKPVFVLYDGVPTLALPVFLSTFPLYPVEKLDEAIERIQQSIQSLDDQQKRELASAYEHFGVPAREMMHHPQFVYEFTDQFNASHGTSLDGARVIQELVRLDRQGQLPQLSGPF